MTNKLPFQQFTSINLRMPSVFFPVLYILLNFLSWITRRFSAFFSSVPFVKLKDPLITVSRSIIMTLLWFMAWRASIFVGIGLLSFLSSSSFLFLSLCFTPHPSFLVSIQCGAQKTPFFCSSSSILLRSFFSLSVILSIPPRNLLAQC